MSRRSGTISLSPSVLQFYMNSEVTITGRSLTSLHRPRQTAMRFPDLSLAFRNIFRRPGFAAVAIALLALGSGANAAVFSVVRGVLIRPLPFPEPDRIVAVWPNQFISNEDLAYWRERTHSFSEIAAQSPGWMMGLVADGGEPIKVTAARVSDNMFKTLGATAALGRDHRARQRAPGAAARRGVVGHAVAEPIQRRPIDHRPRHSTRSGTAHDHRRDAGGLRSLRPRHRSVGAAAVDAGQPQFKATFSQGVARLAPGVTPEAATRELIDLAPAMRKDLGAPE